MYYSKSLKRFEDFVRELKSKNLSLLKELLAKRNKILNEKQKRKRKINVYILQFRKMSLSI